MAGRVAADEHEQNGLNSEEARAAARENLRKCNTRERGGA